MYGDYDVLHVTLLLQVLRACERIGEWSTALRILQALKTQRMNVDIVMYGAIIGACSRAAR